MYTDNICSIISTSAGPRAPTAAAAALVVVVVVEERGGRARPRCGTGGGRSVRGGADRRANLRDGHGKPRRCRVDDQARSGPHVFSDRKVHSGGRVTADDGDSVALRDRGRTGFLRHPGEHCQVHIGWPESPHLYGVRLAAAAKT